MDHEGPAGLLERPLQDAVRGFLARFERPRDGDGVRLQLRVARAERRHPSEGCQVFANRLHGSLRPAHRLGGLCLRLGALGRRVHGVARAHGCEELPLLQPKSPGCGPG